MQLSNEAKQGFFNFMDKNNIGMIDFKQFYKTMNMNLTKDMAEEKFDNFDFQVNTIRKIHEWVDKNNLSPDDAFRVIDHDFDGFLSRSDLSRFLKTILHLPEK